MSEIVNIPRENPDNSALSRVVDVLSSGGLVIVPTETVYGIACDPTVPGALERLIAAKGRDGEKPIARLAADSRQVRHHVADWSKGIEALAAHYWPGPLTMVLKSDDAWVGYRVPDHAVARALAGRCPHMLALTSANLSGEPETRTAEEAMNCVTADLVIDSGPASEDASPSSVIRVDGSRVECLRPGAIPFEEVQRIFEGAL